MSGPSYTVDSPPVINNDPVDSPPATNNDPNEKIPCDKCGDTYLRKETKEHKQSEKHKKAFGEKVCVICKDVYWKAFLKEHINSESHKVVEYRLKVLKLKKKDNTASDEEIVKEKSKKEKKKKKISDGDIIYCKICKETYLRKDAKEHKSTKHKISCHICGEPYLPIELEEHKATDKHKQELEFKYTVREGSGENRQYINNLTAFLILRYAFSPGNFKVSVNSEEWKQYGDIVIEITNSEVSRIEAICCKKILTKSNLPFSVLSGERGHLSIKEQYEIVENFKENFNYDKVYFNLHTISNLVMDKSQFTYDDDAVVNWKADKEVWRGRQVQIVQHKGRQDLLNTTNDSENIYRFQISGDLNEDDDGCFNDKFKMYLNQKQEAELNLAIKATIEDEFHIGRDIFGNFVEYVKEYFRTDKKINNARKESNFKMTKKDILLKIAEVLLVPYLVLPENTIEAKDSKLWNDTVSFFDVVITKDDCDFVKKIYSSINQIMKSETQYSLSACGKVTVEKRNVTNRALKSTLFETSNFEPTLQFMYLALWKTELSPLVLRADNENQLSLILNVIRFLKNEDKFLKFVVLTHLDLDRSYFPADLNVFLNWEDLRLLEYDDYEKILNLEVDILNSKANLEEIIRYNKDFLEKLMPDALLSMVFEEFSFKDVQVPLTKEIIDNTLVLDDNTVEQVEDYFNRKTHDTAESVNHLSYLVTVNGYPINIQVPPEL